MKILKTLFVALLILAVAPVTAQTADEIIDTYIENIGGADAWNAISGVKMIGTASQQGMEIPVEMYQMTDGRQIVKINFQGMEMYQGAFDGETLWGTNFMTMLPEKSDAEATENMKRNTGNYPTPFLNYKEKGYTAEYVGKETKEGVETFKIKLTQKPNLIDGKEEPNVTYFFFETENYVPIAFDSTIPSGEMKGQVVTSTFSDYQEVDGLYFPFSLGMGGQGSFTVKEIILNPEVEADLFSFPEDKK